MSQREHPQKRSATSVAEPADRTADQEGTGATRLSYAGPLPAVASDASTTGSPTASDRAYAPTVDVGQRLRAMLHATTVVHNQVISDQTHAGLIREQESESPVIAGTIKIAARVREIATLSPKGGFALPSEGNLSALQGRLAATKRYLKDAEALAKTDPASAERALEYAEADLRGLVAAFEPIHAQLTSYVERTGRGADLMIGALETTKLVAATAVIMGTGAGAAGLAGTTIAGVAVGGGASFSGMTMIAGASAASAGAMAGAYTAADQFGADKWDPVAIARSAGAAAASTFLTSMLGGALNKVFLDALSSATAGLAGHLGARAQAMLTSSAADRFLGLVAGSVSGGLVAATEATVRKLAAGQEMSREEFCRIVLVEAVKSGLLQLAVTTALSRTKMAAESAEKLESQLVDRTADPNAPYKPDDFVLQKAEVRTYDDMDGLPNVHELLAPSRTDHNNAFYPKDAKGGAAPIGLTRDAHGAVLGTSATITPDSLYVSAHGSPMGMAGGNRELAHLTAKAIAQLAESGDPVARVILNSCLQRDKRFGVFGQSNAEAFEALLKQAMKAHPKVATPQVYAVEKAGSVTGGLFGKDAFITQPVAPAANGGQNSGTGAVTAASAAVIAGSGLTVAVSELTAMLSEHPTSLEQVITWLRNDAR